MQQILDENSLKRKLINDFKTVMRKLCEKKDRKRKVKVAKLTKVKINLIFRIFHARSALEEINAVNNERKSFLFICLNIFI